MNKTMTGMVLAVLIVGAGAFYGGMMYAQKTAAAARMSNQQARFAGGADGQGGGLRGSRAGQGFTAGQIISRDTTGITIKTQDGSTKIILVSQSAQISKMVAGSGNDLAVGTNVTVAGAQNADGSVTAQSVQIRPAGMGPGGTATGGPRTN